MKSVMQDWLRLQNEKHKAMLMYVLHVRRSPSVPADQGWRELDVANLVVLDIVQTPVAQTLDAALPYQRIRDGGSWMLQILRYSILSKRWLLRH